MATPNQSAWFKAVLNGDIANIKTLKNKCAGLRNEDGETALMLAVHNNSIDVLEILLDSEALMVNKDGYTALLIAATENNAFACSILLSIEKNVCLNDNSDALILAAEENAMEALRVLVPGWPVRRTRDGVSALDIVVSNSNIEAINLLLQHQNLSREDIEQAIMHINAEGTYYEEIYSTLHAHLTVLGERSSTPGRSVPLEFSEHDYMTNSVEYCPSLPRDSLPLAYSALDSTGVALTKIALEASDDPLENNLMPGAITPISQQINVALSEVTPTGQEYNTQVMNMLENDSQSDIIEPDPGEFHEDRRASTDRISDTIFQLTNLVQEHNPTTALMKIIHCKDEEIEQLRTLVEKLKSKQDHFPISLPTQGDAEGEEQQQLVFPIESPLVLSATTNIALTTIDTLKARVFDLENKLAASVLQTPQVNEETQNSPEVPVMQLVDRSISCNTENIDKGVNSDVDNVDGSEKASNDASNLAKALSHNAHLSSKLHQAEQELSALSACLSTTLMAEQTNSNNQLLQDFAQREREIIQAYMLKLDAVQSNLEIFIDTHKKEAKTSELYFQKQLETITSKNIVANEALQNLTAQIEKYQLELKELRDTIAYLNEENASLSNALNMARTTFEHSQASFGQAPIPDSMTIEVQTDESTELHAYSSSVVQCDASQNTSQIAENTFPCSSLNQSASNELQSVTSQDDKSKSKESEGVHLQTISCLQMEVSQRESDIFELTSQLIKLTTLCDSLVTELKEKHNLLLKLPTGTSEEYILHYIGPQMTDEELQTQPLLIEDSLVLQPIFPVSVEKTAGVAMGTQTAAEQGAWSHLEVGDLMMSDLQPTKAIVDNIEISFDKDMSASPPIHMQVPLRSTDKSTKKTSSKVRPIDNILMLTDDEDPSLMMPSITAREFRATKLKQIGSELDKGVMQADQIDIQRAHDLKERNLHFSPDGFDFRSSPNFRFDEYLSSPAQPTEDSPLILAVLQGKNTELKKHLKYAGMINGDGVTALMIAAMRNNLEAVKILVDYEKGIVTADGSNALCLALLKGNLQVAKFLTTYEGLVFSHVSSKGKRFTELMQAADEDNILAAWCLIPYQGGLRDEEGFTALMYAVQSGNYEIARILYELEGRVCNSNGETALMLAAASGLTKIVNMLMIKEAGERDDQGRTALMRAAIYNHCDIIRLLLQKEAGIQDTRGETALMFAAKANNPDAVRLLLDKEGGKRMLTKQMGKGGAQYKGSGYTALIQAVRKNSLACVPLLLGKEGHLKDAEGRTPIFFARTREMKELLLEG